MDEYTIERVRDRLHILERQAEDYGCEELSPRDIDIQVYRSALGLPLDGSWRHSLT